MGYKLKLRDKIVGLVCIMGLIGFFICCNLFFSGHSTARGRLATPTRAPGGTRAPEYPEAGASEFLSVKSKLQIFFDFFGFSGSL